MIITFFRSSLLGSYELCPLRMFLEYNIGLRGGANVSALVGSTVHGVLECLLLEKLAKQNNQEYIKHDSFGGWKLNSRNLSDHLRASYEYYNEESPGIFKFNSYEECEDLINKALLFHKGAYHPYNNNAFAAEFPFEIEFKDEWAKYEYESPNGIVNGNLQLKGTIDVIYQEDQNILHCLDYKTSKTIQNWATGKDKDEQNLYYDPQLMLYYYVLANTFPDKDIIMTLYFIRLNKAFTLVFDRKKDLPRIKLWIKERFEHIKAVESPTWIDGTKNGWKCRWCPFNEQKQSGSKLSICKYYQKQFSQKTYDEIMKTHARYDLLNSYGAGGSSKDRE